jgi:hypothetical protein
LEGAVLLVSDAAAPLDRRFASGPLNPWRMKRWLDLQAEQRGALHVRSFIHALRTGMPGVYLQIGSRPRDQLAAVNHRDGLAMRWFSDGDTSTAASFSTSLRDMTARMLDLLCLHGYETAHWNALAYPYLRRAQSSW